MAVGNVCFTKNELTFIKPPAEEIEIECSICLKVMLNDPLLWSSFLWNLYKKGQEQ